MSNKNLYDYKTFFKLTSGTQTVYIDEPVNWDKADIQVPRDAQYFGFVTEFVSDEIQLEFPIDDESAYWFIKNIYDTQSADGVITLQFGIYSPNNVENVQFIGNLNLNTYVNEEYNITVDVEKVTFESLFRTRYETAIDFSKFVTLDNKPITPPTPYSVKLHSRKITKEFKSFTTEPRSFSNTDSGSSMARFLSIQTDTSDGQVSELEGSQGTPLSLSGVDPRDESKYFFKIIEAGDFDLSFEANFSLAIQRTSGGPIGGYNLVPRFMVVRGGSTIELTTFDQYYVSGVTADSLITFPFGIDIRHLKRHFEIGDELFFDFSGVMQFAGTGYNYFVTNFTSTTDIFAETIALPTISTMYRAFDVITKMMEYATGIPNSVRSSIFGPGGCLYSVFCTNGYQIRNFTTSYKPVIATIKDFIESFFPIEGLGYGIETISGIDYLIIEPLAYFYQRSQITVLNKISEYREEHAKDMVFNEGEIGYTKFPDATINSLGLNDLDEYNTYQTCLFPIKTYKAKFTKKSTWITSGYSLEIQRRAQFAENPSDSLTNDDDIFIVSCIEGTKRISTTFQAQSTGNTINTTKSLGLAAGDHFTVVRGGYLHSNDGKTFTINHVTIEGDGTTTYKVDESVTTEMGLGLISFPISTIEAEKNELFNYVTGVLSPDTAYNLRFSPRRMLFNWSKYLNIMLFKKGDAGLIQNTFVKNNSTMSSSLDAGDLCRGYEHSAIVVESSDITVGEFREGNRAALHQPIYAYFKSDMKYDQFFDLKQKLTGNAQSTTDRGYIVHPDRDGVMWKSYVYSIKYTPKQELAELKVAKFEQY